MTHTTTRKIPRAQKRDVSKLAPRRPSRGPGVLRFNSLLDAAERLLATHSPAEIGLYQIGEEAGAPMASVYHFFPTKEAAFLALAERYLQGFIALGEKPVKASELQSWQDLAAIDQRRAVDFYNRHPSALKIFYGGYGSLETRQADIRFSRALAASLYQRFDAAFELPPIPDAATKFHIALALLDAVWGISYEAHGRITDQFYEEGKSVFVAYCGLFLPPRIELRKCCVDAAAKGAKVQLPQLVIA